MLVSLYGTVELAGRRSGYVITLLVAIFAMAMPVLHTVRGPRSAERGFFFVWTLLALGGSGVFSAVLSAVVSRAREKRSIADCFVRPGLTICARRRSRSARRRRCMVASISPKATRS